MEPGPRGLPVPGDALGTLGAARAGPTPPGETNKNGYSLGASYAPATGQSILRPESCPDCMTEWPPVSPSHKDRAGALVGSLQVSGVTFRAVPKQLQTSSYAQNRAGLHFPAPMLVTRVPARCSQFVICK